MQRGVIEWQVDVSGKGGGVAGSSVERGVSAGVPAAA